MLCSIYLKYDGLTFSFRGLGKNCIHYFQEFIAWQWGRCIPFEIVDEIVQQKVGACNWNYLYAFIWFSWNKYLIPYHNVLNCRNKFNVNISQSVHLELCEQNWIENDCCKVLFLAMLATVFVCVCVCLFLQILLQFSILLLFQSGMPFKTAAPRDKPKCEVIKLAGRMQTKSRSLVFILHLSIHLTSSPCVSVRVHHRDHHELH